jgi:hypothetical protein
VDIEVFGNLEPDQDWVNIYGDYDQFHVYGDYDIYEDYVEYTAALMQKAATKCFMFPFYIHFEGYEDYIDSILLTRGEFEIHYQNTGRTVLTMSDGKTYNAEIPSFTVKVVNEESLKKVFAKWFHLAHENCMWLITQSFDIQYKNKFAFIDMEQESVILLADHDAQSLSFITSNRLYRKEEHLRLIFEE